MGHEEGSAANEASEQIAQEWAEAVNPAEVMSAENDTADTAGEVSDDETEGSKEDSSVPQETVSQIGGLGVSGAVEDYGTLADRVWARAYSKSDGL